MCLSCQVLLIPALAFRALWTHCTLRAHIYRFSAFFDSWPCGLQHFIVLGARSLSTLPSKRAGRSSGTRNAGSVLGNNWTARPSSLL
mmetsp:Transcript_56728/g.132261  ORF Transcript_56728/g.132261 Transcript_56728/m.132261 type:complete len:87 (+) Transcript_56728:276-536(+)